MLLLPLLALLPLLGAPAGVAPDSSGIHYTVGNSAWLQRPVGQQSVPRLLSPSRVGDNWGTEIHWHKLFNWNSSSSSSNSPEDEPGEAAMIARAFKLARMDLRWSAVERQLGVYDFAGYDALLDVMRGAGIGPFWILDYANPLYPPASSAASMPSCSTAQCIAAFGRFAAAVVQRYKGHGIIFECLNEPDGVGGDSPTTIAALCKVAGKAFLRAGEILVGPATGASQVTIFMDWAYLNASFAHGILDGLRSVTLLGCLHVCIYMYLPYSYRVLPSGTV